MCVKIVKTCCHLHSTSSVDNNYINKSVSCEYHGLISMPTFGGLKHKTLVLANINFNLIFFLALSQITLS